MINTDKLVRILIALTAVLASAAVWWPAPAQAMGLKEVATVQGVRSSPLIGYGVMVTAQLPAFTQRSQHVDVTVSSLGNAKSLRGATLIAAAVEGADGQIYALAQGNFVVAAAGASAAGSKVEINHLRAGRVPEGATVEHAVPTPLNQGECPQLDLNSND